MQKHNVNEKCKCLVGFWEDGNVSSMIFQSLQNPELIIEQIAQEEKKMLLSDKVLSQTPTEGQEGTNHENS